MSRTADTVKEISSYIWYLLPGTAKFKGEDSRYYELTKVFGESLGSDVQTENVRNAIDDAASESAIETGTGDNLDHRGIDRHTKRLAAETDSLYRARLFGALSFAQMAGTIPGIIAALALIGYTVSIDEAYAGTYNWNRYDVAITAWNGINQNQAEFYRQLNRYNAGHAIPLIDDTLVAETFDDWDESNPIVFIASAVVRQLNHNLEVGDMIFIIGTAFSFWNGPTTVIQVIDGDNFIIDKLPHFVMSPGGYVTRCFDDWTETDNIQTELRNTFDDFQITP